MAPTINDAWYQWLLANLPVASGGSGSGGISNNSQVANQYESQANVGTRTAPATFTSIAQVTVTAAGFYRIRCFYGYGATAESTTPDNFQFVVGASNVSNLIAVASAANTIFPMQEFYKKLNVNDIVQINSGGTAGSAGSIYKAQIIVDRLS